MTSFEEFMEVIDKSMKLDPWNKQTGLAGHCKEVQNEANEVMQAIEKKDYQNLMEELGDTIADCIYVAKFAETEGKFTLDDVWEAYVKKINRRKPFLAENREVTMDEATRIWQEIKAKEVEEKTAKNQ